MNPTEMSPKTLAFWTILFVAASNPLAAQQLRTAPSKELWIASWTTNNVVRCDIATGRCDTVIPNGLGGLRQAHHVTYGPDGDLYVASWGTSSVMRYNGSTFGFVEEFVAPGDGGLQNTHTVHWGTDGHLLCAGEFTDGVLRYDGSDGAFIDAFIPPGGGGLDGPEFLDIGPDGLVYVTDNVNNSVRRYDPQTGAFIDVFVANQSGRRLHYMTWNRDGDLLVSSSNDDRVLLFDGKSGDYVRDFVEAGSGGVDFPAGLCFGPDGHLYVASFNNHRILKYDGETGAWLSTVLRTGGNGFRGPLFITFMPEPRLPMLGLDPGRAGETNRASVYRVTPSERVVWAWGTQPGEASVADCAGLTWDIANAMGTMNTRADAQGHASCTFRFSRDLAGSVVYVQAIELATCRKSGLLRFRLL